MAARKKKRGQYLGRAAMSISAISNVQEHMTSGRLRRAGQKSGCTNGGGQERGAIRLRTLIVSKKNGETVGTID